MNVIISNPWHGRVNLDIQHRSVNEPQHDKTNKMACAPSEDSDQPGHPPSLTRVFAVRMNKPWAWSYPLSAQRRLWSDWSSAAQADLSLRWAHMSFCWFCHAVAQMWNSTAMASKMYFFVPTNSLSPLLSNCKKMLNVASKYGNLLTGPFACFTCFN